MKIVITARDFSVHDAGLLEGLVKAGHEVADHSGENMGTGTAEYIVYRAAEDADIAITGLEPYNVEVIRRCPKLKMISRRGIGYDSVDLAACKQRGIVLARTAGMVEEAVAEHVMAYILHFARNVEMQSMAMHDRQWSRIMMAGAKTRTLGLIGFGGIGIEIAKRAVPFGMKVIYYCRHPKAEWEKEYHAVYCDLDKLLSVSDYVSVNVPLTEETRGMFGEEMFRKMKPESIFINTARGPVADVAALKQVLQEGRIRGAAIDVFDAEPCTDSPLIGFPNVILTPHTASYTSENFDEMNRAAVQNVIDFMNNKLSPGNRVV